jgi:hypothetical protein
MKTLFFPIIRSAGLLSGALLIGAGLQARAEDTTPSDAFPSFESYIKVSGQLAPSMIGNKNAFQSRANEPSPGGFGIEDFHYAKDLSKTTTQVIDGKALSGSEDYLLRYNVTKTNVGSVDVGYKRFRTFYDGVGGFFPLNQEWLPFRNQDLHIDRAKFWVEANVALPDAPVITVRYTNELRDGRKDSTIWGSTDFTGLPNTGTQISDVRKIIPSYINVGERHERLETSVKHTIKTTSFEVTLFGDRTNNADTRYVTLFPGEVKPVAGTSTNPARFNNQVLEAQTDAMKTQTTGFNAATETAIGDKLTLQTGAQYSLVHSTIGGDRPLITSTPTAGGTVPVTTDTYQNLAGGTRVKDFVGNASLEYRPIPSVSARAAWRIEDEFISGASTFNALAASGTPATTVTSTPRVAWEHVHRNTQTPELDLGYTGIRTLALYGRISQSNVNGVDRDTSAYNPLTASGGTLANNNDRERHTDYTVGANWRTSQLLTLRAEYFSKGHKDNSAGYGVNLGDYYLLDSQYTGYKITALATPWATLGFTTRFVSQHGKMKVTGFLPTYPAYNSGNTKNYMIGETINWTPCTQCYVQLDANVVFNVINTVYPTAGITPATSTLPAFDSNKIVQNSNNNYVTGSFLTGFVMDKETDLEFQVDYYRANDGNAAIAPWTVPYGVQVRDVSATIGLKHKFTDRMIGEAKVGYFDSKNDTTGGFTSYHGPVGYVSLAYAL